jgi:hypothetical protein
MGYDGTRAFLIRSHAFKKKLEKLLALGRMKTLSNCSNLYTDREKET